MGIAIKISCKSNNALTNHIPGHAKYLVEYFNQHTKGVTLKFVGIFQNSFTLMLTFQQN